MKCWMNWWKGSCRRDSHRQLYFVLVENLLVEEVGKPPPEIEPGGC